jgi:hypothetical protein
MVGHPLEHPLQLPANQWIHIGLDHENQKRMR